MAVCAIDCTLVFAVICNEFFQHKTDSSSDDCNSIARSICIRDIDCQTERLEQLIEN